MGFVNLTPFVGEQFLLNDERGADVLTFVVKATYEIKSANKIDIAEEQLPIYSAGQYYGDPEKTSMKYAPEADFTKPSTDVALIGSAHTYGENKPYVDVNFQVGPVERKLRVFGNRYWTERTITETNSDPRQAPSMIKVVEMSSPEPFEKMPIVYEYAFGGWDRTNPDANQHDCDQRNPVGRGFLGKHATFENPIPLPNVEDPYQPIQQPTDKVDPVGFGFINPDWKIRAPYAGTFDDQWQQERMPLPPTNFQRRFFNAAHPDLITREYLKGDEPVQVENASAFGALNFKLPGVMPEAVVRAKSGETARLKLNLDTVVVNTEENNVVLLWRNYINVYKKINDILWAKTQLVQ